MPGDTDSYDDSFGEDSYYEDFWDHDESLDFAEEEDAVDVEEDTQHAYYQEPDKLAENEYYDEDLWAPTPAASHSVDEFGCTWVKRFRNRQDQWTWLGRNARRLGKEYNVPPEELVLGEPTKMRVRPGC